MTPILLLLLACCNSAPKAPAEPNEKPLRCDRVPVTLYDADGTPYRVAKGRKYTDNCSIYGPGLPAAPETVK